MASTSPMPVQASPLVINTLDPQPVPPSIPVVIIETTANQPTTVPEAQQAMLSVVQELADTNPCHPSISLVSSPPTRHEIRIDRRALALVRQSIPIIDMEAMDHNNLADLPCESSTFGSHHTE